MALNEYIEHRTGEVGLADAQVGHAKERKVAAFGKSGNACLDGGAASPRSGDADGLGYQAIFFDLDGTLLPMELEDFIDEYFVVLAKSAARHGFDPAAFSRAVGVSVKAMAEHDPEILNADAFWNRFECEWGHVGDRERAFFDEFYEHDFDLVGKGVQQNPAAARAVNALRKKGYPLYLTTMPMFPKAAVERRLRWAGVDPVAFRLLTCYDNSTACKPHLHYYRESIQRAGVCGQRILMVGNNTEEDLVAMQLGMDAYLVTDYLINPNDFDIDTVKHGTLSDFADFAESLPDCRA